MSYQPLCHISPYAISAPMPYQPLCHISPYMPAPLYYTTGWYNVHASLCFQFRVYEGTNLLHQMIAEPPVKMASIGAANSELTASAALLAELNNLIQVRTVYR